MKRDLLLLCGLLVLNSLFKYLIAIVLLTKALELFLAQLHGVTLTWLVAFQSLRSISDIWGKKCHGILCSAGCGCFMQQGG